MPRYRMTIHFNADRELTQIEIDALEFSASVQVMEPQVLAYGDDNDTGDGDWVDAEWVSSYVHTRTIPLEEDESTEEKEDF